MNALIDIRKACKAGFAGFDATLFVRRWDYDEYWLRAND
jgi:hypothetical protein